MFKRLTHSLIELRSESDLQSYINELEIESHYYCLHQRNLFKFRTFIMTFMKHADSVLVGH